MFLFLTYFMQQQLGYPPVRTGLAFLPMVAALMFASILAAGGLVAALVYPNGEVAVDPEAERIPAG